jgi:transcriptional regulator with XRE-family HTH domain
MTYSMKATNNTTKLQQIRKAKDMTQLELSIYSRVKLRTIQELEQGRKDINKAEALNVYNMAEALGVAISEILEISDEEV